VAHRIYDEDVSLANVPREKQNEVLIRAILLELALYKLWTLLAWRLGIDGLLGKKDSSSRRFERVWMLPITYRPATRMKPGEGAMTCSMLEVFQDCPR
jgi:hypothetical protein